MALQRSVNKLAINSKLLKLLSTFSSAPLLNISEKDLNHLPLLKFQGKVRLIRGSHDEERFQKDLLKLSQAEVLGFDTESCSHGPYQPPCMIQLASNDLCFIWRIRKVKAPGFRTTWLSPQLVKILMSENTLKVGHGCISDAIELLKQYHLELYNIQDTFQLATQVGLQQLSLRGLVGMFLGHRLDKKENRSNWESNFLSQEQLMYASTDAWASLKVYEAIVKYMSDNDYSQPNPIKRAFSLLKPNDQDNLLEKLSNQEKHRHSYYGANQMVGHHNDYDNGFSLKEPHLPKPPVYVREEYERRVLQKWYHNAQRYNRNYPSMSHQQDSAVYESSTYSKYSNGNGNGNDSVTDEPADDVAKAEENPAR